MRHTRPSNNKRDTVPRIVERRLAASERALGPNSVREGTRGVPIGTRAALVARPSLGLRAIIGAENYVRVIAHAKCIDCVNHGAEAMHVRIGLDAPENLPVARLTADAARRSLAGGCGGEEARFLKWKGHIVLLRPWINRIMRHVPPEMQVERLVRLRGGSHVRDAPFADVITHIRGPPLVFALLPLRHGL